MVLFALPAAIFGTTFIIGHNKEARQFTKVLLLTGAVIFGLKFGVKKRRPDMSSNRSFPSVPTSTVLYNAGSIHRHFCTLYSIAAYALAGFTSASRIDSKKQEILDVLTGSLAGHGSNFIFTTTYQLEHRQLTFSSGEDQFLPSFN